eukprot:CAMPEP_0204862260 /NCGR_PEP_ID=MMETSP1348-20121228/2335_1 /ASSEMBLY_ACC=CAM_ASM_000700 /TAXON_ID=215587 /ORGANISM="Aplanochytrium stocchinoi, Strain GSBS06" /LENGTH=73 /DNA_ID=CAMNT_0052012087 /DNA_START=1278 /DNA_END=1499 /DNA_ORIENTATION=-
MKRRDKPFTLKQGEAVAAQVALGLKFLHSNNVIHGNMKPNNLLLSQDEVVKIIDFELAFGLHNDTAYTSDDQY